MCGVERVAEAIVVITGSAYTITMSQMGALIHCLGKHKDLSA